MANEEIDQIFRKMALPRTRFGVDAVQAVRSAVDDLRPRRVLLVEDSAAAAATGIAADLRKRLSIDAECGVFDVSAALTPAQIDSYGQACAAASYDCIVAVGGGATLDAAKLIALCASNGRPIESMLRSDFTPNAIPMIAVPTTAGSGSEATHFAVLFVGQQKYSVAHVSLRPRLAIIDPTLTHSVPRRVAAAAGLDALCQSIESLWSRQADPRSQMLATEALDLIVPNLRTAVIDGDELARAKLSLASHLAGQAIDRSFTTICHALSYMLTAEYRVLHGFAAAATLPAALRFNAMQLTEGSSLDDDGSPPEVCLRALFNAFGCSRVEDVASELAKLIRSVGGAASVSELDLSSDYQPARHAKSINVSRLENNPRPATLEDCVGILRLTFDADGFAQPFSL